MLSSTLVVEYQRWYILILIHMNYHKIETVYLMIKRVSLRKLSNFRSASWTWEKRSELDEVLLLFTYNVITKDFLYSEKKIESWSMILIVFLVFFVSTSSFQSPMLSTFRLVTLFCTCEHDFVYLTVPGFL